MKRESGILYPISSLPTKYGIGGFSIEAYEFVDFLKEAGQRYWQILPLGPTGFGDSPYQSFSTFAGNPYFISLENLIEDGLLTRQECESYDWGSDEEKVDYGALYNGRYKVLKTAYDRFKETQDEDKDYQQFLIDQKDWLEDYCLYMALKQENNGMPWSEWEDAYKNRDRTAMALLDVVIKETVDFFRFQQYEFMKQWTQLKTYANEKGIKIIGDIPFYVSFDSSDTWANPEMFKFDEDNEPISVAGCPPDAFSATGQLWGNPIYDWKQMKKNKYKWWVARIKRMQEFYDVIRIDHFRGFDEYYAIPYGDETAENGEWEQGPGMDLFNEVKRQLGEVEIIAEDLGYITPTVRKLLKDAGFPGMKVLQFAFDAADVGAANDYLPHNYDPNCVVYTGTHDNETIVGWLNGLDADMKQLVRNYVCDHTSSEEDLYHTILAQAMRSCARICILPIQDCAGLDNSARMNQPSTVNVNWRWRMKPELLSDEVQQELLTLTRRYGRFNWDTLPKKAEKEAKE